MLVCTYRRSNILWDTVLLWALGQGSWRPQCRMQWVIFESFWAKRWYSQSHVLEENLARGQTIRIYQEFTWEVMVPKLNQYLGANTNPKLKQFLQEKKKRISKEIKGVKYFTSKRRIVSHFPFLNPFWHSCSIHIHRFACKECISTFQMWTDGKKNRDLEHFGWDFCDPNEWE